MSYSDSPRIDSREFLDRNPYISIVVITFNSQGTIRDCLSSVFGVSYPKESYEVIVVDAGSSDKTLEIIKDFPVDRVIIKEKALRGEARNIGMQEAKGEIVAMIDSDLSSTNSFWLDTVVAKFNDPDVAMVTGSGIVPLPKKDMNFFQRASFFMSIHPDMLKEED